MISSVVHKSQIFIQQSIQAAKITVGRRGQNKITEIASSKISTPFQGSFLPAKFTKEEIKELDKAGIRIEKWNQAVLQFRKEIKELEKV